MRLNAIADKALRALNAEFDRHNQEEAEEKKRIQKNLNALDANRKTKVNAAAANAPPKKAATGKSVGRANAAPARKVPAARGAGKSAAAQNNIHPMFGALRR